MTKISKKAKVLLFVFIPTVLALCLLFSLLLWVSGATNSIWKIALLWGIGFIAIEVVLFLNSKRVPKAKKKKTVKEQVKSNEDNLEVILQEDKDDKSLEKEKETLDKILNAITASDESDKPLNEENDVAIVEANIPNSEKSDNKTTKSKVKDAQDIDRKEEKAEDESSEKNDKKTSAKSKKVIKEKVDVEAQQDDKKSKAKTRKAKE